MGINRSSFYFWKSKRLNPAPRVINLLDNIKLFQKYHALYPSHGYRWLNAKIRLDTDLKMSDPYAHKCCKIAGIKSQAKRCRYRKPGEPKKVYPNLLSAELQVDGPKQCVVSDMTAFNFKGIHYELTMFMDIWNNEILTYSISSKRGDRMTYINGLNDLCAIKAKLPDVEMILHTDQGSVYASKAFNDILPAYNIQRSMSRAGTPTDNAVMEAINGWVKAEIFMDFHLTEAESIQKQISDYVIFFNEQRPAYALQYLTPKQYRERYAS